MHYVRGIRTRALRKRHSASFLAAARRLLQSIKTADQGCFAKDKNESLFLRHKKPDKFCRVFCCFGRVILRNKIRGPRGILCTRGEKEHTSKRVSIIAPDNAISKAKLTGTPKDTFVLLGRRSKRAKDKQTNKKSLFVQKKDLRRVRAFARTRQEPRKSIKFSPF